MPVAIPMAGMDPDPDHLARGFRWPRYRIVAANVWPLLLLKMVVPLAAGLEVLFLALYVFWASGNGRLRHGSAWAGLAQRPGGSG